MPNYRLIVGSPSSALIGKELTEESWNVKQTQDTKQLQRCLNGFTSFANNNYVYPRCNIDASTDRLQCFFNKLEIQDKCQHSSNTSICSTKRSMPNTLRLTRSQNSICSITNYIHTGLFGRKEIEVYMTLFNDFCNYRASGTQATAFINKCLQVNSEIGSRCDASTLDTSSYYDSTCTMSTMPSRQFKSRATENTRHHDVYFFGRKKDTQKCPGMGCQNSCTKAHKTEDSSKTATKTNLHRTSSVQTKNTKGACTATNTMKAVSIKDDKPKKPCPALGSTKGDMTATVSHIRIGPTEPCPVHGNEPCQGPKCIIASSGEEKAPVKVTTVTNPRRGVFELVIRKMTGAPLAKNELMLEWTPPPSRPAPCGGPCPIPCAVPTPCLPSKCKLIVCRALPCKPKFCKKPCGPSSCVAKSCCGKKCVPCGPPLSCRTPCTVPCAPPCCRRPCSSPCKSSPCLRPCPVGRKRARKIRSQPKIRAPRKRVSPCLNRSKTCPVVRCRSMPGPCIGCCGLPPCPPRKCCSVAPCKPPKCCKSVCSTCCI